MGWSIKHDASVNGGVDWSQILLQSGAAAELEKPPLMRRQQQPEFLKCPRCGSTNTKFCYYNNYNKSQPRYICKACKRHWTKGGTLRNVPVGGGRKNKRPKNSNPATSISSSSAITAAAAPQCPSLNTTNLNASASKVENTECPFSSLGTFDTNSCFNVYQDYTWNLDSAAESTITSVNNPTMSSVQQWQIVESCSGTMDLANDWNWNEIEELVSPEFKFIMG